MSYNRLLNIHPSYREKLIDQLISNTLPPSETVESYELSQVVLRKDPLLLLLSQRKFHDVDEVMNLQYAKFGTYDTALFWSSLKYVESHVAPQTGEVGELLARAKEHASFKPEGDIFERWHRLYIEYFATTITYLKTITKPGVMTYTNEELCDIFSQFLVHEGLADRGWIARTALRTNLVSIARKRKRVLIGARELLISQPRLIGLLIHEIVIHVKSAEYAKEQATAWEEGVGTLMEQLMLSDFQPLRLYRFLAIGLAIGVDGKKRAMSEVYQLLLPIKKALAPETPGDKAAKSVAKEIVRVYRNLPYDIPGLVYIRDKYYLEHNVAIWGTLAKEPVSINTLHQLIAPWEDTK